MNKFDIKKKFYLLKSKTMRWFAVYLPVAGYGLEVARDNLPALQGYIPDSLYKGILIACVVGVWLRTVTDKPLDSYKKDK